MRVDDFDFNLPEERIALEPASARDGARLLHVANNALYDRMVGELPLLLRQGDMLVLNDTRVIPAQLSGVRHARDENGSDVTVDVTLHKQHREPVGPGDEWHVFIRPAKRIQRGDRIDFSEGFYATVVTREGPEAHLAFNLEGDAFNAALNAIGLPPLPPYIARKRKLTKDDSARYQTIFAQEKGSVAAPTAGLHFTEELFASIDGKSVRRETITLHVGPGTFLPVSVEDTADHKMHAEWGEITKEQAEAINNSRASGGRLIAVGTTSLRLLESAANDDGIVEPFCGETSIFITPGYHFKCVDALMTNFHLPRSTLFMLVCAFAGMDKMKKTYAHAIKEDYRFYSYGDACFLERTV